MCLAQAAYATPLPKPPPSPTHSIGILPSATTWFLLFLHSPCTLWSILAPTHSMPPMSPCDAQRQGPPDPTQTCMQGPLPIRLSKYILKCYFKLSVVTGTCLLDSTPTALDPITESDHCLFTNRCASDQYTDTYRIANRVQTSASSKVQDGSHNRCQHYLLLLLILKSCCVCSLRVLFEGARKNCTCSYLTPNVLHHAATPKAPNPY